MRKGCLMLLAGIVILLAQIPLKAVAFLLIVIGIAKLWIAAWELDDIEVRRKAEYY